jgi:precorrin-6y C5,15-methyltransferase (decarboxylating) CbiE subunit
MSPQVKAYLIGVGPGSPEYVTPAARRVVARCELVLGWDLDLRPIADCLAGKKVFLQDVNNYVRATRTAVREAKKRKAALAIPRVGDPCLSSGLKGVLRALHGFTVEVIPGISSVQLAAAVTRINLDESVVVSFHDYGDPEEKKRFVLDCFRSGRHLILLASPDLTPGAAAAWLIEQGISPDVRAVIGSSLSLPEQQVVRTRLARLAGKEFPWLTVSVFINPAVPTIQQDVQQWRRWRKQKGIETERS